MGKGRYSTVIHVDEMISTNIDSSNLYNMRYLTHYDYLMYWDLDAGGDNVIKVCYYN